jgi:hypothetical protein
MNGHLVVLRASFHSLRVFPSEPFAATDTQQANKENTRSTMDDLREKVAMAIDAGLLLLPPKSHGFKVGDLLLLNRNQNPAQDKMHGGWFSALHQNISEFLTEFVPPQPDAALLLCGSTTLGSTFVSGGSRVARDRTATISLSVGSHTFTNARTAVNVLYYDEGKMSSMFLRPGNTEAWIHKGRGVVAFVEQSWGGNMIYKDSTETAASPVVLGASMDMNRDTSAHLQTSGVGVVGINVSFFKLATVEEHLYRQGPTAILSRQQENQEKLAEAVSWCKLGKMEIRDGSRDARTLTAGRTKLAHLITPVTGETTWGGIVRAGVRMFEGEFPASPGLATDTAQQCAFSITHDTSEIGMEEARGAIVTFLGTGSFGDVTTDDAPDAENVQRGYNASKNVILWYSEAILSNIFIKMMSSGGSLDLGEGFRLKGMRPALVFDMDQALLLPVFLSTSFVVDAKTCVPTTVFRALANGAFLITPVQGVPSNCEAQGLTFGNGGCEGWDLTTTVKYLDEANPSLLESKMTELENQKYAAVQRFETDIDYEHKRGQVKMVHFIVEPTVDRKAAAAVAQTNMAPEVEDVKRPVQSTDRKHAVVPPDSDPPLHKKQKMHDA